MMLRQIFHLNYIIEFSSSNLSSTLRHFVPLAWHYASIKYCGKTIVGVISRVISLVSADCSDSHATRKGEKPWRIRCAYAIGSASLEDSTRDL